MVNQERSSVFIAVRCQCGRNLRAKVDQGGTEIRCWDCRRMVRVPFPDQAQQVAREFSDGALVVIKGPGMNSVLIAAAIVTAILAIPIVGTWCSVIAFTLGASAYGEIIRRAGGRPVGAPDPAWWEMLLPGSITKFGLSLFFAVGTVFPLWILNSGEQHSPHWDGLGRAIAAATWTVLPLLMLGTYGRYDAVTPLGSRRTLELVARHPIAISLALALIPATLLILEAAIGLVFYIPGHLPFFALDYMPAPQTPSPPMSHDGILFYDSAHYQDLPASKFISGYFDAIRHGYSFVGAIPASLANSTRTGLHPMGIGLPSAGYLAIRLALAMTVITCLIAAFGVQARWLGSIPSLRKLRPAPAVALPMASIDPTPSNRSDIH